MFWTIHSVVKQSKLSFFQENVPAVVRFVHGIADVESMWKSQGVWGLKVCMKAVWHGGREEVGLDGEKTGGGGHFKSCACHGNLRKSRIWNPFFPGRRRNCRIFDIMPKSQKSYGIFKRKKKFALVQSRAMPLSWPWQPGDEVSTLQLEGCSCFRGYNGAWWWGVCLMMRCLTGDEVSDWIAGS